MSITLLALIAHLIGAVMGVGGATATDAIFLRSIRDRKISKDELNLIKTVSHVVVAGLAISIASGLYLFSLDTSILSSSGFQIKMTIILFLTLNGTMFHIKILPLLDKYKDKTLSNKEIKSKLWLLALTGGTSAISWYSVLILGMVMRFIEWPYAYMFGGYLFLVTGGALSAYIMLYIILFSSPREVLKDISKKEKITLKNMKKIKIPFKKVFFATSIFILAVLLLFAFTRFDKTKDGNNVAVAELELTPKSELKLADSEEVHVAYAPNVPAPIKRDSQRIFEVHIEVLENVCDIDPENGISFETWGYRVAGDDEIVCGSPGPVLRGRVGDVARVTLTNLENNELPHNIDFHAATGPGGGAKALTVAPGETATIEMRLLYPGVFQYHCAFGDVPVHVSHGQYGMFIVDPEIPLAEVEHEWAIMQSEWYLTEPNEDGLTKLDLDALLSENPAFVTFNGTTNSLVGENALKMNTGERARIYFVNQGLNLNSNFHPIGSHWDVVYPEGATHPANDVIHGSQSTLVVTGGGSVVELEAKVPGDIILVDHALSRAFYKGALGIISVSGLEDKEVFEVIKSAEGAGEDHDHDDDHDADVKEFTLEAGNFYFSKEEIRVKKGDTVRITLENVEGFHDWVLDEFGAATKRLREGESQTIEFVADREGEFEYYCSVGTHRAQGQVGTLIVEL